MMQTGEADLRAEADEIKARRADVIRQVGDGYREMTVVETIDEALDTYGRTQELARALCWGMVVDCAERADWDSVRLVIAAYNSRYPRDGAA